MIKFLLVVFVIFQPVFVFSQSLKGVLTDENGSPVPGANIYIKNSNVSVVTDKNGYYQVALKPGKQTVVFNMMGFNTIEKTIVISDNKAIKFDTAFSLNAKMLNEAVISSDNRSLGKEIMQKVKDKRKDYLDSVQNYQCVFYRKTSLENLEPKYIRDSIEKNKVDSLEAKVKKPETRRQRRRKEKASEKTGGNLTMVNYVSDLDETISILTFEKPSKYKEVVIAENPYNIKWPRQFYFMGGMDTEEGVVVESGEYNFNEPYLLINNAATADFNFYKPTLTQPSICIKPLLSPIAPGSALSYVYDYDGVVYSEKTKYYKIKVKPIFPADALYSGYIMVQDSTWALHSVDLYINPDVLLYCKSFRVEQTYQLTPTGISVPEKSTFTYQIKEGKRMITGSTEVNYYDYNVNTTLPPKTFTTEVKVYQDSALDKDSAWWAQNRLYKLSDNEIKFIRRTDSLSTYYNSDEYIFKTDSSSNHIDIWNILYEGISHSNRKKQTAVFITPLVAQINPLGIGGYRHTLGAGFFKRFKNDFLLETEANANYGFANKDLRGRGGVGLTYVPRKFIRTFIRFGDYYDQVNNNASIGSMFSRSNYVRTQTFSIAQRMEIVNGLFGELTYTFSDQTPITDMKMDSWSNDIFGTINTPIEFERYTKSEFQLELRYRPFQRYVMKNKRKILLGSSWPDITFVWRKGIPGLFNSEVNFDYFELGTHHELKLARWGRINWAVKAGDFVNKKNLRILEYKYFRGSDNIFFSSPTRSLQLLGPTLSSSTAFMQLNIIHHFEGAIVDKIPLFSRLKISPAVGAGALFMQESSFRHAEVFGGLERVFRIRRQLFRIGLFAVTADNNINKADFSFKIGINMYNSYTRKWDY